MVLSKNNKACKAQDYVAELKKNLLLINMFDPMGLTIKIE